LAQARGRLAVDDRRGDRVKVASQCPCISVGTPHLDHGVGGMTFGQQQASRSDEWRRAPAKHAVTETRDPFSATGCWLDHDPQWRR
jgi:hypothetical protein